jgi:monothiol glutaredoxin
MENAQKKIDELVKSKDVLLFMKGSPEQPQCGFSMTVSKILKDLKIKFYSINVLEDEEIRVGIKQYSNWPTIPQLYIKGNFIGGCDIVKEMYQKGELQKILKITT